MTFESKRNCGNQISKQIQVNSHGWNFHPMGLWEDESLNLIRQAEGGATIFLHDLQNIWRKDFCDFSLKCNWVFYLHFYLCNCALNYSQIIWILRLVFAYLLIFWLLARGKIILTCERKNTKLKKESKIIITLQNRGKNTNTLKINKKNSMTRRQTMSLYVDLL